MFITGCLSKACHHVAYQTTCVMPGNQAAERPVRFWGMIQINEDIYISLTYRKETNTQTKLRLGANFKQLYKH